MRKVTAAIIGLLLAGLLAGPAQAADTLKKVKEKGELVVGVKYRVPPFGFLDDATGELVGFDVDVAKAIASKLGVKLKLQPVDQKSRIPLLLDGSVDLVAANVTPNPDTGMVVAFSEVYLTTGVGFLTRTGTVKSIGDLDRKKIAVGKGTVAELAVGDSLSGATAVPFEDYRPALEALTDGSVDAGAGDISILPVLLPLLPKGEWEVPPFQIAEIPYVLGMSRGDPGFLDFINKTVGEMQESGELQKFYEKWFRPPVEAQAPAGDGPVAEAAAVISRKASTPPRFVAVIMRGEFEEKAPVSVFSTSGEFICNGTVAAVFDDTIYVDVEKDKYGQVRSGFAVGMGVNMEAAKGAVLKHQDVLMDVKEQSKEEAAAVAAEIDAEAKAKEARDAAADKAKFDASLQTQKYNNTVERDRNSNYGYYRGYRGRYYR
ncbi:MAG: transporter substrate-binding domain-containing protein [Deferrisomatales bacterium]|nr:transporter substrate-binding domain-containing protein [Deferrisomatales bacterium]